MVDNNQHLSTELSRELTLFHITMMGLGMMIGAGVFIGIGNAIGIVGPGGVLLTFALNGVIALFTAMSYAELSSAIPKAGGAYNFARIGFGRGPSFIAGWMEWFASSIAGSMYAIVFSIYTLRYLEHLGVLGPIANYMHLAVKTTAVLIALFFLYINYRGASETGKIGALFTLGQTLFMVIIGIVGFYVAIKHPDRLQNFNPFLPNGWERLLVTMGFTYVAFEGYEVIAQAGDEAIDPKKNLPKAMIYSVLIVTLTYVAVAFATVVAVKAGTVDKAPWEWIGSYGAKGFGEAVAKLMPFANLLLTLAVIFASTSALNATIFSATRASFALGRDKMLPSFFAKISPKRKTPYGALIFTGLIVIIVAAFLPTMHVASSASIMFLFLFFLVNFCVIRIRINMSDELDYGFLMPLFPLFPILAIIAQAVLAVWLVHMSLIAWIIAPLWILSGVLIYNIYSKHNVLTTEDEIVIFEEEKAEKTEKHNIMISVANPKSALSLIRNTYKLCDAKNAHVELLHMVPVPDQVALSDADKYMSEGKEAIYETMIYLVNFFPISTTIRYCRNIARGIVSAVKEKNIQTLILGWHGKPRTHIFSLGSTIDPIIERAPCNVVIFKDCGDKDFKKVFVPLAGGGNGAYALEIASILVDKLEGEILAFTVKSGKKVFDINSFVETNKQRLHIPIERVKTLAVESNSIIDAILSEADNYDLIVVGGTEQPMISQITHATMPELIAQKCHTPLVVVKASGGIKSWIKKWI
ncbi:MAG: hypothetical protein DRI44_02080 [Chlamydiae bacterium]|nr:MAG: hypothetical protein DRI44_02080 [Chlamydiota bacterium]